VAVQQALSTVAIAATATAPSVALGQENLEEVVVTGSRIAGDANLVTSSPVTQIKAEEIGYRGITRVEDLMNDLPQVVPELTANDSNGSTGTATLDLRGLGSDRTLVLTNGHRMGFGDPFAMAPDINTVPGALIERVEILTGGASSTYGSDAIAGVVNFVMKQDFEGVQIDYQYSAFQHDQDNEDVQDAIAAAAAAGDPNEFQQAPGDTWDGGTHDINVVFGVNSPDGRGNITGYLGYRDVNDILQSERDFSACSLSSNNGVTCAGSATSASGLFAPFDGVNYYTVDGTDFVPGIPYYNYGPLNYFQRPDERYTAGMFAHYEVNEHFEPYAEFQFMDDRSLAQIAPSGAFFVTGSISCDNPFLSAQQLGVLGCAPGTSVPWYIGRRYVEGGPRFDDLRHTTYRILGGVRGNITEDWTYDVSANFNRLVYAETYQNDMSITRIGRALDVIDVGGVPTCRSATPDASGVVVDAACVPWNIFEEGAVTQAAINYLTLPLFSDARLKQDQYVGFVTGDLTSMGVVSPMATDGVKVVLGGEYRDETMDYNVDQNYQSGDGAGQGGSTVPIDGGLDVIEFFLETKIPLVQDREWIESLTLDAGYRYSDYSTGVNTDTWKAIGEWTPTQGFKLRGGYSRAVRHANLIELFEPQNAGLWSEGGDPCAGAAPSLTAAQCALTGVTAAQYGSVPASPAGQYNGVFGGNPELDPEKANSFTVGAVFTPEDYVPGLQFSLDYWHIEVKDAIANVEPFTLINTCGTTGDAAICGLINRSPLNGNLWVGNVNAPAGTGNYVQTTNVNIGFFETAGLDFVGAYTREVGDYGNLDFAFRGTMFTKWDQQEIPGGTIDDCVGTWGGACSRPTPEWKHTFTSIWTTPWDLVFVGTWRMIGGVDELSEVAAAFDAGSEHYVDLTAEYTPQFIGIGETKFTVGVTNVGDNDPPANGRFGNVAVYGTGNTIPGTWDAMGRYFFFALSQKF
jgi:outer membrane receptor protein involved in Fe transport